MHKPDNHGCPVISENSIDLVESAGSDMPIQDGQQATPQSVAKEFGLSKSDVQRITTRFVEQISMFKNENPRNRWWLISFIRSRVAR